MSQSAPSVGVVETYATNTHSELSYRRLEGDFGVLVDADLSQPLSPRQQAEFRRLFDEHGLIVLKNQTLSQPHHVRALSYLNRGRYIERDPEFITNVEGPGLVFSSALPFHADSAFLPEPMTGVSLHAIDVVDDASSTRFTSGKTTYQRLPEELKQRIEGLHTLHVQPKIVSGRNRTRDLPAYYPRTARLLVHNHPFTGDPVLYVSFIMIDGIIELSDEDSDALLDELYGYLADPAHVYEHRWRNGDVVIWDNVALLHSRDDTSNVGRRVLQRVSVGAGNHSDIYPEFPTYTLNKGYKDA